MLREGHGTGVVIRYSALSTDLQPVGDFNSEFSELKSPTGCKSVDSAEYHTQQPLNTTALLNTNLSSI